VKIMFAGESSSSLVKNHDMRIEEERTRLKKLEDSRLLLSEANS